MTDDCVKERASDSIQHITEVLKSREYRGTGMEELKNSHWGQDIKTRRFMCCIISSNPAHFPHWVIKVLLISSKARNEE